MCYLLLIDESEIAAGAEWVPIRRDVRRRGILRITYRRTVPRLSPGRLSHDD